MVSGTLLLENPVSGSKTDTMSLLFDEFSSTSGTETIISITIKNPSVNFHSKKQESQEILPEKRNEFVAVPVFG